MAVLNFYDRIDYRNMDFDLTGAVGFYSGTDWTINNITYPTGFGADFGTGDDRTATEVMGTGFVRTNDAFTAGTVNAIYHFFYDAPQDTWFYNYEIRGLSLSAVELQSVIQTASVADDQALLAKMFSRADRMNLSNDDDLMKGFGGNDTILGNGGNDTLLGGFGNDKLNGGKGHDMLYGGQGRDALIGSAGNDSLYGNDGRDTLSGGRGDDLLVGGNDQDGDTFVFTADFGTDTIREYEHGLDVIRFEGIPAAFEDLVITAANAYIVITLGDDVIRIDNSTSVLSVEDFTVIDFDFL